MTAFNVVRFRTRPGMQQAFIEEQKKAEASNFPGLVQANLVRTGDRDFCFVGEWTNMDALVAARPAMIAELDKVRTMLESLGEVGVTDPASGEAIAIFKGDGKLAKSA